MAVTDTASADGLQVELTGALALLAQADPSSELIGVGVAIIVLLVAFGSVVAMGLPIATALFGIFVGAAGVGVLASVLDRSEEHTSELQSLMRISYAVFCLKKKNTNTYHFTTQR